VKDANACVSTADVVVGYDKEIIYEVKTEDVICPGDQDGKISVTMTNNQGYTVSYSLNGAAYQASPQFANLAKGTYNLTVKKELGMNVCETTKAYTIKQLIDLKLQAKTSFSCEKGGSLIVASVDPIYDHVVTYTLDGTRNQTSGIFEDVTPGEHTVTVKHNDYGCGDTPVILFVEEYKKIEFTIENTAVNEYTVVATGGVPGYEYSFDNQNNFGPNNVLRIRKSKDYTFYVKDTKGCVEEKTVFLDFLDIEIPEFFTPQGDGINDYWYPIHVEVYPNISVKIFDRYQRLIAEYKGPTGAWDGNYDKKALPSGDYWYIIKLNEASDNREFKGHFSLIR
jgi:gliding motility-associated-like protein